MPDGYTYLICAAYRVFDFMRVLLHCNGNVTLMKYSSLAALKIVKMTTFSAEDNFVKMATFSFQCYQRNLFTTTVRYQSHFDSLSATRRQNGFINSLPAYYYIKYNCKRIFHLIIANKWRVRIYQCMYCAPTRQNKVNEWRRITLITE